MGKMNDKKIFFGLLLIFLIIELLSFWGFKNILAGQIIFVGLTLLTAGLTIYKLEYGLLAILGELFIGSLGHLFFWSFVSPDFSFKLGIRTALWAVFMLIFLIKFLIQLKKAGRDSLYWQNIKKFFSGKIFSRAKSGKLFLILFSFIIIGLINGFARRHSLTIIFSDFNNWLYLLLLFPLLAVYGCGSLGRDSQENNTERDIIIQRLKILFLAGAVWIALKTLFLLFVFTHDSAVAPDIYLWLRRTLVGEMTPTKSGWPRVFIQGQIFPVIAFLAIFWHEAVQKKFISFFRRSERLKNFLGLLLAALFFTALIISFSRSFWVAFAVTGFFSWLALWRLKGFKIALRGAAWLGGAAALGFILIYLTIAFPYIETPSANLSANLIARVSGGSDEPALASRWSLLPVLSAKIKKEPLFGQGFGATVTYFSRDPRILENNPSGEYTTYAFEWAYLDIWLKIGLFGLLSYLILIFNLIFWAWLSRKDEKNAGLVLALAAGLLFLAVTNIFTPYLNHPLGLGWLLLASCLI
ncbi:MAG: O-antigen ligase family protein [Patescibacteria group bacterium]